MHTQPRRAPAGLVGAAVALRRCGLSTMQARYVMYALLAMAYGVNIMQRNAINFLVPLIAHNLRLPIEASGMLLGCFFPTYVLTQIPGAFIINLIGFLIWND